MPGCDTSDNPFNELIANVERSPYEKLLNISSSFVFINKGRAITEESNQTIIKKLYRDIKDNSSLGCEYLKNCLFCVNMFESLTEEEKEISKMKKDYSLMLFENDEDQENNSKYLNVSLFNAESYLEYLKISSELNSKELLMNQFKENFKNKNKKKEFSKFCLSFYKTKLEGLSFPTKIDKTFIFDNSIDNWFIDNIMKTSKEENSNINQNLLKENSLKLSHIYQCTLKRIKENKYYIDSNCEEFFTNLENQIIGSREFSIENFKENMEKSFTYFDMLFQKEIQNISSKNRMEIKKESDNIISQFEEIKNNQEIGKKFDDFLIESIDMLEEIKKNSKTLLKKYNNNLEKLIKAEFEEKIQEKTKDLEKSINRNIEELNLKITECQTKVLGMFKLGLKEEIDEGRYTNEIKTLIEFSFSDQLKLKICKYLGINEKNIYGHLLGNLIITVLLSISTGGIIGLIVGGIYIFINIIVTFFTKWFKTYDKMLNDKLNDMKQKLIEEATKGRIKYYRLYLDLVKETKGKFVEILSIIYADLSRIEHKKWIELKEEYINLKNNILIKVNNL